MVYTILHLLGMMICFSPSLEARLYFMHVPKTGGTTLRLLLEAQLAVQEIYPYRNRKSAIRPVKETLVSGHFPYWFYKTLDETYESSFKITVLREPVERYLSFLRAKKKADTTLSDIESVLRLRSGASNKYREGLVDNAICRYLTEDPLLEGEALLESAKHTLQQFDCVLFFDHFSQDVIDLFHRLGMNINEGDIPKINTIEIEPINIKLLETIISLNELDIRLYEYAKKHMCMNNSRYLLSSFSLERVMESTSVIDYTFDLPLSGKGWSYRERGDDEIVEQSIYRWVMDHPATIYFSLHHGSDYVLLFNAKKISDEVVPQVKVNGREIDITRANHDTFSLYQGMISKECVAQSSLTEITFYSAQAFHYRDIHPSQYNRNHPPLSFAINRIQIYGSP